MKQPRYCPCGKSYFDGCDNGWEIHVGEEIESVNFCPNCGVQLNGDGTTNINDEIARYLRAIKYMREYHIDVQDTTALFGKYKFDDNITGRWVAYIHIDQTYHYAEDPIDAILLAGKWGDRHAMVHNCEVVGFGYSGKDAERKKAERGPQQ